LAGGTRITWHGGGEGGRREEVEEEEKGKGRVRVGKATINYHNDP